MNEEKTKKVNEIAHKLTDAILSECEPSESAMVVSIIMSNLHNMHRERIADSEINLKTDQNNYSEFLKNIDLPQIKDVKEG